MEGPRHIRLIERQSIDESKWNDCIRQASNGLIYACTFYLDHMSPGWVALVLDDYKAVMPLTGKRKYGVRYLAQPFLTAQLGLFGNGIDASLLRSFLEAVPGSYRYCDIYLNHGNLFAVDGFDIYERSNFVLDLRPSYEELQSGFRENIRRNVKRSKDVGCRSQNEVPVESVIELAVGQMRSFSAEIEKNIGRFRALYAELRSKQMAKTYGIVSAQGKLLSSAVFFYSNGRAYYILVGNHPDGRTLGASHALIDHFIEQHSGRQLLLDFEGSDIRNLAFFYSSFGAREEKYAGLKWNRLPFWMKWLKK